MIFVWIKALFKALGDGIGWIFKTADGLTMNEWYFVMALIFGGGLICLRGFGSRKSI